MYTYVHIPILKLIIKIFSAFEKETFTYIKTKMTNNTFL